MVDYIFSPVRHHKRVTALQRRLRQIKNSSAKAAGFTLSAAVKERDSEPC